MLRLRIRHNNPLDLADIVAACVCGLVIFGLFRRGTFIAWPMLAFVLFAAVLRIRSTRP